MSIIRDSSLAIILGLLVAGPLQAQSPTHRHPAPRDRCNAVVAWPTLTTLRINRLIRFRPRQ
jgi:hypothetical protein